MVELIFGAIIAAFILAFMDNTVGLGYGTILTAILLMMGFEPLIAVPAIIFSGAINGIFVAFAHHKIGNINFKWGKRQLNIVFTLFSFSIIGIVISLFTAISLPTEYVKGYMALIIILMGLMTL
ncbi:MAG: sulfite exporter TauE/SafE family protein, partial [Candidatus Diapherotrites archaeon]|nr:sulfite exporter TauE/SafE family protein [Candidatus Diapherotrites archaeon]